MWMGKIGQKSAAFINHKPFHPGNIQNQEKIWKAEEKQRQDLKKQKEMLARREEEVKILQLRQALRRVERREQPDNLSVSLESGASARKRERSSGFSLASPTPTSPGATGEEGRSWVRSSLHKEDVLVNGHSTVYGSHYDPSTGQWGYKCCGLSGKGKGCPAAPDAPAEAAGNNKKQKLSKAPGTIEGQGGKKMNQQSKQKQLARPANGQGLADLVRILQEQQE
eukprot:GHVT01007925.1.p1 GENE.GHVT01007925.1~~GHVT01007925.1.p1  ORF type:complete len:224 (+),score=43.15 GHVT01007925.1:152-823(+)